MQVYISVNNIPPFNIQADWSWQYIYHNSNFTYKPPNVPSPHIPTLWQLYQDSLRPMDKVRRYVTSRVNRMSRSESIRRLGYFSRYTPIHGTNHHECHLLQTHKEATCLTLNLLRNMFNKWGSPQHKNQNSIITKLTVAHSSDCSNTLNTNPDHTDISVPPWDLFKNKIALALPHIHI